MAATQGSEHKIMLISHINSTKSLNTRQKQFYKHNEKDERFVAQTSELYIEENEAVKQW